MVRLVDPFFSAFFNDPDHYGMVVQEEKRCFSDTVELEDGVFPAFATGKGEILDLTWHSIVQKIKFRV
jgi:hypothetical protein